MRPADRAPEVTDTVAEPREAKSLRPLIIERTYLQSAGQRWGYRSLTIACWALWIYLFMPLVSVLAWAAGLTLIYEMLVQDLDLVELWDLLKVYGAGIGVLCGIYLLWAVSSYLRFKGVERRQLAPRISAQLMASSHRLDMLEYIELQNTSLHTVSAEQLDKMFAPASDGTDTHQDDARPADHTFPLQ